MCASANPNRPNVQMHRCQHGSIHLTIGQATLHVSPRELNALHELLERSIQVKPEQPATPTRRRTRIDHHLN